MLLGLAAIGAVLYGCWVLSKYLSKKVNVIQRTANLRILERVALSQDKGVAILELCGKYYLVGFSPNSVELLREIDEDELVHESAESPKLAQAFSAVIKSRMDRAGTDRMNRHEKSRPAGGREDRPPHDEP